MNYKRITRLYDVFDGLSRRQEQVLLLALNGKSSKQIADLLGISVRTVEAHRYIILKKASSVGKKVYKEIFQDGQINDEDTGTVG